MLKDKIGKRKQRFICKVDGSRTYPSDLRSCVMSAIMICVAELLNPAHSPNSKGEFYRIRESERETYQPCGTWHTKSLENALAGWVFLF